MQRTEYAAGLLEPAPDAQDGDHKNKSADLGETMTTDQRQSQRKELRVRARLTLDGGEPVWAQTADIGKFGMGLARIPENLASNAQGLVQFEVMLAGQIQSVSVRARIAYCISSGTDFSAGIQFLDLQSPGAQLIAQYVEE